VVQILLTNPQALEVTAEAAQVYQQVPRQAVETVRLILAAAAVRLVIQVTNQVAAAQALYI
jgi:hypothetical protein